MKKIPLAHIPEIIIKVFEDDVNEDKSTCIKYHNVKSAVVSNYLWVSFGDAYEGHIIEVSGSIDTVTIRKTLTDVLSGDNN